jgi:hypothetical protein
VERRRNAVPVKFHLVGKEICVSQTRPPVWQAADATSAVRPCSHISGVLVSLAIAATMSFALGHLSMREAPAVTGIARTGSVALTTPSGATTDQFAGGAIPVPPRPV